MKIALAAVGFITNDIEYNLGKIKDIVKKYSVEEIIYTKGANYCDCGGYIRPDVRLYGEGLNQEIVNQSIRAIANTDVLIIGGTSLVVYPAASFINFYRGNKCILINKEQSGNDGIADYLIHDDLVKFFSGLEKRLDE
ncbi:MAG: Sir2 family NAD-dependent protein deacetylase [Helcococcus sp.]|nr:Sir2 family NAD-dependent protein deacetylase [Helcococcus sp.]